MPRCRRRYPAPILEYDVVPERFRRPDEHPRRKDGTRCSAALQQPDGLYTRCEARASRSNGWFCRNCHGDKRPERHTVPAVVVVRVPKTAQLPLGYALLDDGFLVTPSPLRTIEQCLAKGPGRVVAIVPLALPEAV